MVVYGKIKNTYFDNYEIHEKAFIKIEKKQVRIKRLCLVYIILLMKNVKNKI